MLLGTAPDVGAGGSAPLLSRVPRCEQADTRTGADTGTNAGAGTGANAGAGAGAGAGTGGKV